MEPLCFTYFTRGTDYIHRYEVIFRVLVAISAGQIGESTGMRDNAMS